MYSSTRGLPPCPHAAAISPAKRSTSGSPRSAFERRETTLELGLPSLSHADAFEDRFSMGISSRASRHSRAAGLERPISQGRTPKDGDGHGRDWDNTAARSRDKTAWGKRPIVARDRGRR